MRMPAPRPTIRELTVLTTTNGQLQVKRHTTAGTVPINPATYYTHENRSFTTLQELHDIVANLKPTQSVMHAKRNTVAAPNPIGVVRCLIHPDYREGKKSPPFFEDRPTSWLLIDLDTRPLPEGVSWKTHTPEEIAMRVWFELQIDAPQLRGVGCVWKVSGSAATAGNEGLSKFHFVVLLSKELLAHDRKKVLRGIRGADDSVGAPSQRHYMAGRTFDAPLVEPLAGRIVSGIFEGGVLPVMQTDKTERTENYRPATLSDKTSPLGAAKLTELCAMLASTVKGARHNRSRDISRLVGGFVGSGVIALADAQNALCAAVSGFNDPAHHEANIEHFLTLGIDEPVALPNLADHIVGAMPQPTSTATADEILDDLRQLGEDGHITTELVMQIIQLPPTDRARVMAGAGRYKRKTEIQGMMATLNFKPSGLPLFDQKFFKVRNMGGDARVVAYDGTVKYKHDAFHRAYCEQQSFIGLDQQGNEKFRPLTDVWLKAESTITYDRVEFSPGYAPEYTLPNGQVCRNSWRGHRMAPQQGEWPNIREYLFDAICGGDQAVFEALVAFVSQLINEPGRKPKVSVTLYSEAEGVGKGVFFTLLKALIGPQHAVSVSDIEHVVGRFNDIIDNKLVVFMDEVGAIKDGPIQGKMRNLISEDTVTIESKGDPIREVQSYHRVISSTNKRHAVWLSHNDRRNIAIEVPGFRDEDGRIRDKKWWFQMVQRMGDELGGFMHHLMFENKHTVDTMPDIPHTKFRAEQVAESNVGIDRVIYEMLNEGNLPFDAIKTDRGYIFTSQTIDRLKQENRRVPITGTKFARAFGFEGTSTIHVGVGQGKVRGTLVPLDLNDARALFAQHDSAKPSWNKGVTSWGVDDAPSHLTLMPMPTMPGTT